jgi:hypothetical protein
VGIPTIFPDQRSDCWAMSLKFVKRGDDTFVVAFEGPEGRLTCEISVARQGGVADRRAQHEKYKEARIKLSRLISDVLKSLSA